MENRSYEDQASELLESFRKFRSSKLKEFKERNISMVIFDIADATFTIHTLKLLYKRSSDEERKALFEETQKIFSVKVVR